MLGLQGNSSASKVYRCMACSATFTGLASLLVHQATHAAAMSAPLPALPSTKPPHQHEAAAMVPLRDHLSSYHHPQPPPSSSAIVLFESPSDSLYICDCGDEFKDFNVMLEHKRVHLSNPHLLQPRHTDAVVHSGGEKSAQAFPPPLRESSGSSSDAGPVLAPMCPQAPDHHASAAAAELKRVSPDTEPGVGAGAEKKDAATAVSAAPREQSEPPRRPASEKESVSAVQEPLPEAIRDMVEAVQDMTEAMQDIPEPVKDMPEAIRDMTEAMQDMTEAMRDMPDPVRDMSESIQEGIPSCNNNNSNNRTDSVPSSSSLSKGDHLPKNNNFMKLLATAYRRRFQPPPPAEMPEKKTLIPKTELVPVEVTREADSTREANSEAPLNTDPSVSQLRQLLKKTGMKTKSPGVGRILDSSTKSIVSLTKTFSPVVLLETRQTLVDPTNNGARGIYQCGRCRRVFKDVDTLTEHHSMHRKERIKCCRHCKKLIIGKMPFPDNHVCPQLSGKATKQSNYPKTLLPHARNIQSFTHLKQQNQQNTNQKRVFFCPTCKHSYARRYNLKMHKCQGRLSAPSQNSSPAHQKQTRLTSIHNGNRVAGVAETPILGISKTVGVGTETAGKVKVEPNSAFSDSAWSGAGTPKSFPPFFPNRLEQHMDASQSSTSAVLLLQEEENVRWDAGVADQREGRTDGQWTSPLDEEMEALSETDLADMDDEVEELVAPPEGLENSPANAPLPFFVSNGVKRYPCGRCQKTYSRQSTLRRHLMLCGTRQPGFGTGGQVQHFFGAVPPPRHEGSKIQQQQQQQQQQHMFGTVSPKINKVKPMFDCYVCGKSFNRKDNMLVHRNKCELNRTVAGEGSGTTAKQSRFPGGPSDNKSQKDDGDDDDDGNNWGIMSLPSVLPRRVTCECGLGFTSPRLLLEHLQKHAQENYTCPTCGETVGSWADYEVHLQIHMHPHHQLYNKGGLQPKRSQPLLLRFQQQPSPSSRPHPPPPKQQQQQQHHRRPPPPPTPPPPPQLKSPAAMAAVQQLSTNKGKQRIACTRCNNTFSSRCSLRRHVSLNRCKGMRVAAAHQQPNKTNHRCSRCNADFPSTIALIFHQRSGACKPAGKPTRCPVCARWFGTAEGLQKHMLSHHHQNHQNHHDHHHHHQAREAYRCDVCQGYYPNLKSLKNHRRRVHRIMAGDVMPRPKLEPMDS